MPSGKTHDLFNEWLFLSIFISSLFFRVEVTIFTGLFIVGYFIGTYYLSPDLDTKSKPFYRWELFRFIWIPYRKMFRHRSFWTHGIVVGDIVRFFYMTIFYLFFVFFFSMIFSFDSSLYLKDNIIFILRYKWNVFFFFMGVCTASLAHILADHSVSYMKGRKKRK